MQLDLLHMPAPLPEGFAHLVGLVSPKEERALVRRIGELEFHEFEFQGFRGKRRTVSFGLHYDFAQARLEEAPAIPAFLMPLRDRAAAFARIEADALQHALVTEYSPGSAIGWHRDRSVFQEVIGVSLLAQCRFRFRRKRKDKWERASLVLEPRSAYLLRGPARTAWEHSIPPVENLRYSITFRSLRAGL